MSASLILLQSQFICVLATSTGRSRRSLCAATATLLSHYSALNRTPNLHACFKHVQNKRGALALKGDHGDPLTTLSRPSQFPLRHREVCGDLDALGLAFYIMFKRNPSAGLIAAECERILVTLM